MRCTQALYALLIVGIASTRVAGLGPDVPNEHAPPHWTSVHLSTSNPDDDPFGFRNFKNNVYTADLIVSGQTFVVQLDTRSSDLWLDTQNTNLQGLEDTGVVGSIIYVDGTGTVGNIKIGSVTFGNCNVPRQAFIDARGSNATIGGSITGVLGIGLPLLSNINKQLNAASSNVNGLPFLDNIFDPNKPNFITFLLSRSKVGTIDGGEFTIGTVVQEFSDVQKTPQLPVVTDDNWFTFMDAVDVNGRVISGGSLGSPKVNIPEGKTLVLLDAGTSLSTAPPEYVKAMFNVPGARFDQDSGFFIVPCDTKVNVSMIFGNREFPLNPLDLIVPIGIDDSGNVVCVGAFTFTPNNSGVDFILGDVFLRNVYSLFDFGTFSTKGTNDPFIQILSVTDKDQAWAEYDSYNNARLQAFIGNQNAFSSFSSDATPICPPIVDLVSNVTVVPSAVVTQDVNGSSITLTNTNTNTNTDTQTNTNTNTSNVNNTNINYTNQTNWNRQFPKNPATGQDSLMRSVHTIAWLFGPVVLFLAGAGFMDLLKSKRAADGKEYKALKGPSSTPPETHHADGLSENPYPGSYKDNSPPYEHAGL